MSRTNALIGLCSLTLVAMAGCDRLVSQDQPLSEEVVDLLHDRAAELMCDQHDFDGAVALYDQIIALDSEDAWAHLGRGLALTELRRPDEALRSFDRAIQLDEELADAYAARGWAWEFKEQWGKALEDYRTAIRLDAENIDALSGLAWVLATCPRDELRNGSEAIAAAQAALRLADDNPITLDTLATGYAEIGDFSRAISCDKEALRLVRESADPADDEFAHRVEARIREYEQGRPHRDTGPDAWQ